MNHQVSIAFEGIDSDTPPNEQLRAIYTKSFAYYTVKDRLPVILTKAINYLATGKANIIEQYGKAAEEDLKSVIGKISKLKNEVVTNKLLIKLCSKGEDVEDWNSYLEFQSNSRDLPCWYYSPWLYVESYMYRRLWEIFENSETLQKFDIFANQKKEAFDVSASDIKAVGKAVIKYITQTSKLDIRDKFVEFMKLSLWSNRCDLSLSYGEKVSAEDFNLTNLNNLDLFLLSDDSLKVYEYLKENPNGIIDFVNDNSSYELFSDFCFCDLLCTSSLVSKIRFHVKKFPWFVSDTTKEDINLLFIKMEKEGMDELSRRWQNYFQDGTWTVSDEKYWTLPFDYNDMKTRDSELYNLLAESRLVIFKGDLNYRKLLGDINWNHFEEFKVALRNFKPTSVLSLRTVKADLICGINQDKSDALCKKNKIWMRTGEYAVIQFYCKS